jgi:hypothetical protein
VGPFKVVAVTKARTLQLLDSTGAVLNNNIPFQQVKKIADPNVFGDQDAKTQVVERILDDRIVNNQQQYLVKWKHFPENESSWEPVDSFNELGLLQEYNSKKAKLIATSGASAPVVVSDVSGSANVGSNSVVSDSVVVPSSNVSSNSESKVSYVPSVSVSLPSFGVCGACQLPDKDLFAKQGLPVCLKCYHSLVPVSVPAKRVRKPVNRTL